MYRPLRFSTILGVVQWGHRMTEIVASRVTGGIDGDFVVFLIGMRINKPWKVLKWLPVAAAPCRRC